MKGKATATTQQKDKASQHNSPETVIFQKKMAASSGIPQVYSCIPYTN